MPFRCETHQWAHPTEPWPYCRESRREYRRTRPRPTRYYQRALHDDANADRAKQLSRAIAAAVFGDVTPMEELFTPDVVGSGPAISVTSRDELAMGIKERRGGLVDIEIAFAPLDVSGPQAAVEWVASGVHSGSSDFEDSRIGTVVPPGKRIRVRAVTVAEFEQDRISSFRSYLDDLGVLPDDEGVPAH